MAPTLLLRTLGPLVLTLAAVVLIDRRSRRRGLQPPGFRPSVAGELQAGGRRALALAVLAAVLWIGVFGPLGLVGSDLEVDLDRVSTAQLFQLHGLFAGALGLWYLAGFAGHRGSWTAQLGLRTARPLREIGLGLAAGLGGWLAVLVVLALVGSLVWALGGDELFPEQPPAVIPWLAGLPVLVRLAVSLSAGLVEEAFFRGFLQPRVGIGLSTLLFVLAHAGYQQPMMLVGIVLLSLFFALLVQWRQNIWPAVAAHTLFDAVQLLVVVPTVLEYLPAEGLGPLAPALGPVW